jgi:hypothetical protein
MNPTWLDTAILALYGQGSTDDPSSDFLRVYVEPMWSTILNHFDGSDHREPLVVPVHSPAASPTTFTGDDADVLVFDMHLVQLIFALTLLVLMKAKAETVVPALSSIFAERLCLAGNLEASALMAAGSRIAVASNETIVLEKTNFDWVSAMCRAQIGFIIAHELAHLAFAKNPVLAANNLEEHRSLLRETIAFTHPAKAEHGSQKRIHEELKESGYSLSSRAHDAEGREQAEQPLSAAETWELVSRDQDFMVEVMADHMACIALLRTHRKTYSPGFLASVAMLAMHNLETLRYLDQLAADGYPSSIAKAPQTSFWHSAVRATALRQSLGLIAVMYAEEGEPGYPDSLPQLDDILSNLSRSHSDFVMKPLFYSIDFEAIARAYATGKPAIIVVAGDLISVHSLRKLLGFGASSDHVIFTKYINVAVAGD